MSLYAPCAYRYLQRMEKNGRFPAFEIAALTNNPLCGGCYELNPGPLE